MRFSFPQSLYMPLAQKEALLRDLLDVSEAVQASYALHPNVISLLFELYSALPTQLLLRQNQFGVTPDSPPDQPQAERKKSAGLDRRLPKPRNCWDMKCNRQLPTGGKQLLPAFFL